MKTRLLALAILFFTSVSLMAQVTGSVQSLNGAAIGSQTVYLQGDSMSGVYMTTTTNPNGQFNFTSVGTSSYYDVYTYDCNQGYVGQTITSFNTIVNLQICIGGGNPGCVAAFNSIPDSNNTNLIHFNDLSSGSPTSWSWSFGDGTSSTAQNPNHTYSSSGTYTVWLYISSANCFDSIFSAVTIGGLIPCQSAFYATPNSTNQYLYYFTDLSTGNPTSWSWDFGDGTTSSAQNPNHTYATSGTYYVTLAISSSTCNSSYSSTVYISGNPTGCQASFYSVPDSINTNKILFFDMSTGSPTSWSWSFGDGTSSTMQNPTHTYSTTGTYTVVLAISSVNCFDSISIPVTVGGVLGCQSAFTYTPDSNIASMIYFNDASTGSPTSWMWSFGDGSSSNIQNPTHTYASAGTYSVSLLISGPNCQSMSNSNIVVAGSSSSYSVSGQVTAGSNILSLGTVSLYNAANGAFVSQTSINPNGAYYFTSVTTGNYLVFAIPDSNSTYATNYAATYYTSSILWSSATTLNVNANKNNIDISLFQIVPIAGNGSISGNLSTGSKGAVAGAVVNLLNTMNSPIASTVTNANGDFHFNNIGDGTYKIWVEIAGKTTTPIVITLSAGSNNSENNDFVVKNNSVVPKTVSIDNAKQELSIKTYPNPVENQLNIALSLENNSQINLEIVNLTGQVLISNNYYLQAGSQTLRIDLNKLSKGSYILRITNANGTHSNQLITKIR